ncbi:MAG: hypothetical protein OEY44_03400 [Candidatus Peregrinibacteria bacterium]|nr:hypothetical protein [Candidatus Peregrinibacteria bacterium]
MTTFPEAPSESDITAVLEALRRSLPRELADKLGQMEDVRGAVSKALQLIEREDDLRQETGFDLPGVIRDLSEDQLDPRKFEIKFPDTTLFKLVSSLTEGSNGDSIVTRIFNALQNAGIKNIGELLVANPNRSWNPSLGEKSLEKLSQLIQSKFGIQWHQITTEEKAYIRSRLT